MRRAATTPSGRCAPSGPASRRDTQSPAWRSNPLWLALDDRRYWTKPSVDASCTEWTATAGSSAGWGGARRTHDAGSRGGRVMLRDRKGRRPTYLGRDRGAVGAHRTPRGVSHGARGRCPRARLVPELHRLFPDLPPPIEQPPEPQRRYLFNSFLEFVERGARVSPSSDSVDDLQPKRCVLSSGAHSSGSATTRGAY